MDFTELFRTLYGVDQPQGCTDAEIDAVKEIFGALPAVVETFWRAVGRTKKLNQGQDTWFLPEDYSKWKWLRECGYLVLLNENQGVCRAGIRREDLTLPDPPVYTYVDQKDWVLSAPTTSEFLEAALLYEAVFTFPYTPEDFMHWLSEEDMEAVQNRMTRRTVLKDWFDMDITCYQNRPDNLLAVLDVGGGEFQAIFGGTTQEGYAAMLEAMDGLGEPL